MASLHQPSSHGCSYQSDFNHSVKDFSGRAMFLIAAVARPLMIYRPDRIAVPGHLLGRTWKFGDLFLPDAQVAQTVLAIAKCPVQVTFLVQKLHVISPVEDGKFILLAQIGRPLSGTLRFAMMFCGKEISGLMPSSSLWMFMVLHGLALLTLPLHCVGATT